MSRQMTEADARAALATVEQSRQRVIDEIDMPRWYWWGLAVGWIGLAVIADLGSPWLTLVATFAFGAAHAMAFGRLQAGRRGTGQLSVRRETAGWYAPVVIIGSLLGLAAVTIAGALLARADGAEHPVTVASIPVAVAIVLGGPALMAAIRRRAERAGRRA
jgi:hypothetical protein